MEPPVSVPVAAGIRRAATDAAEPPELPPGTRLVCQGFFTFPKNEVSLDDPIANSSILVFPIVTHPAFASRWTTVASYGAVKPASIFEPQVVRSRFVQKMSLCAIGMPVRLPDSFVLRLLSASSALAKAPSSSTLIKALRSENLAIRSMKCLVSSTLLTSRFCSRSRSAFRLSR